MTIALGLGIGTKNAKGDWLDSFFPAPLYQPEANTVSELISLLSLESGNLTQELSDDQLDKLSQSNNAEISKLANSGFC